MNEDIPSSHVVLRSKGRAWQINRINQINHTNQINRGSIDLFKLEID